MTCCRGRCVLWENRRYNSFCLSKEMTCSFVWQQPERQNLQTYSRKLGSPNESIDLKLRPVDKCLLVVAAKTLSSVITLKYMNTSMWQKFWKLASQNVRYNNGFQPLLSEESPRLSDELRHPLVSPSHHQLSIFRFSLVKFAWSWRSWTFQPSITFSQLVQMFRYYSKVTIENSCQLFLANHFNF